MPEIDRELVVRAVRWCAESGRPVREEQVRAALAPLGWDELLAVKATLADPPPGRSLGPDDLVALARGAASPTGAVAPPAVAAPAVPASAGLPRETRRKGVRTPRAPAGPTIRRARDRVELPSTGQAALPHVDGLFREAGRAELGRLVRRLGASRPALLADLARRWAAADGGPPTGADLDRLLEHHGLARAFAERERALHLHAVRKHGGVLFQVAAELGTSGESLRESIREARRRLLDRKATLSERARLLDEEGEALADLGILPRYEDDLRLRLPGHLRALAAGGRSPSAADLGRSLSLSRGAVDRLVARFGLSLRPAPAGRGERPGRESHPDRGAPSRGPRRSGPRDPASPRRPAGSRPPPRSGRRPL